MSTAFRVRPDLPWDKLFAELPEGVQESIAEGTSEEQRCLTNGSGYLWASKNQDGNTNFERYGLNHDAADEILDAIAEKFDLEVFSEHDEGFWDEGEEEEYEEEVNDA